MIITLYILLAAAVLIADIVTKYWAVGALKGTIGIPVIEDFFHLTYVENSGVAFGMLENKRIIFITLSVIILIVLGVYYFKSENKTVWLKLGCALICSGSVGNLIERITKGYVVDFLDVRIVNFPVFNVADIAVCVGAFALVVHFLFYDGAKDGEENG